MFSQAQKHRYIISDCFEENILFLWMQTCIHEARQQSEGGWKTHDGRKISSFHCFLSLCRIMLYVIFIILYGIVLLNLK